MNTRLFVLGILARQPKHGYDIKKGLEAYRTETWAGVLPGSIYHALKQMASEGMVTLQATEHSGHRARAVYAITPAGKAELQRLLQEAWRIAPRSFPTGIYAALAFSSELPRQEVLDAIEHLLAAMNQEMQNWEAGEAARESAGQLNAAVRACFDNGREHLEADTRLLLKLKEIL
jgi:DNA-binding PadR family transcriptional regulator